MRTMSDDVDVVNPTFDPAETEEAESDTGNILLKPHGQEWVLNKVYNIIPVGTMGNTDTADHIHSTW